jgi:hypothetical protein
MSMTLIETKTLGSSQSSIAFTSIPQDATDLFCVLSVRVDRASVGDGVFIAFNSDTSAITHRRLVGTGSSAFSDTGTSLLLATGATATANTFGNISVYILNYAGSTQKSYSSDGVNETNATAATEAIIAGRWANTAAITSLTFTPEVGPNFVAGSTISLYKITKGSFNGVVVS